MAGMPCCCDDVCPLTLAQLPQYSDLGTFKVWYEWTEDVNKICCFSRAWFDDGSEEVDNPSRALVTGVVKAASIIQNRAIEKIEWQKTARPKICMVGGNYYQPWPLIYDGPDEAAAKAACPQRPTTEILSYSCPQNRNVTGRCSQTAGDAYKWRLALDFRVLYVIVTISKVRLTGGKYVGNDGELYDGGPNVISEKFVIGVTAKVRHWEHPNGISKHTDIKIIENLAPECYNGNSVTIDNSTGQDYFDPYEPIPIPLTDENDEILTEDLAPIPFEDVFFRKYRFYDLIPNAIDFDTMVSMNDASYILLNQVNSSCFPLSAMPFTELCVLINEEPSGGEYECTPFQIVNQYKNFSITSYNAVFAYFTGPGSFLHSQGGTFHEQIFVSCDNPDANVNGETTRYEHTITIPPFSCDAYSDYSYSTINPSVWWQYSSCGPDVTLKSPVPTECLISDPCVFPYWAEYTFPQSPPVFAPPYYGRYYLSTGDYTNGRLCNHDYYNPVCNDIAKYAMDQVHYPTAYQNCEYVPFNPTEICLTELNLPIIRFSNNPL